MTKVRALYAIYISVAISYLGVGLVAPLISLVLHERGASRFVVGLVGTTMFAAFTLASFPLGHTTDKVGAKPVLVCGLALYGISILLFAFIEQTWLFFVVRAVEGVAAAAISVATETMINHLSEHKERARRMGYYALSVAIGWALGPLSGTALFSIRQWIPFVGCFIFSGAAAIMVSMLVPRVLSNDHRLSGVASGISRRLVVPVSGGLLYGYLMSSLVTLFPLYLSRKGIADIEMGAIITSVIVGAIAAQIPIAKLADRFGKHSTLLAGAILQAGLFVLMTAQSSTPFFIGIAVLIGASAGTLYPLALAIIGEIVASDRLGRATALFSLAFGFGSLSGPALSGLTMDRLGDRWLFYLPAILAATFSLLIPAMDFLMPRRASGTG